MGELLARLGRTRLLGIGAGAVALLAAVVTVVAIAGGGNDTAAQGTPSSTATHTATAAPRATATPEASPTPIKHAGILDGWPMSDEEWEARKDLLPLAVMVDNTTGAYPHFGLNRADVVYEAFVEGGITRLMAVYWRQDADKILPVRSARTPFVIWASELGAMYGHAGSASTDNEANAAGQIVQWGIRDLNAFSDVSTNYYYRDGERYGPYDLATSTSYLRQAAGLLGYAGPPAVESWSFREPGASLPEGEPAGGIEIDFQGRLYSWQYIQWKWDEGSKRYLRYQFGGPHLDAETEEQLAFATVIVMEAPSRVVDEPGHVLYEQLGSGPATVFTGGMAYPGTWKKDTRESRTRFYAENGDEIVFERGPVFIELLGNQSSFRVHAGAGDLPELPRYEPPPPGRGPAPEDIEPTPTEAEPATPSSTATSTPGTPATPTSPTVEPSGSPSPGGTAPATQSPAASTTPEPASPTSTQETVTATPPATDTAAPDGTATQSP